MMTLERDEKGHFLKSEDSLAKKTLGVRIAKGKYDKFEMIAKIKGISLTELAREAIHQYIDEYEITISQEKKKTF